MGVIVGIDLGGSTTKIAALQPEGTLLSTLRIQAGDPLTSLYGGLGSFLEQAHLGLGDIQQLVLTGLGASYAPERPLNLPCCCVEEFEAGAAGALQLSGLERAVVATLGTGTAFLWAERGKAPRHLCGSGLGGGTLQGLSRYLLGSSDIHSLQEMAARGALGQVDLQIRDVCQEAADTLDPDMTASNFGGLHKAAQPEDLAAGVFNLVLQAIGTMTVLAAQSCSAKDIVLLGSLTELPTTLENFRLFEKLYGLHYCIPQNAAYATAMGACLTYLEKKP